MSMLRVIRKTGSSPVAVRLGACAAALSVLAACSTRLDNAPVIDRSSPVAPGTLSTVPAQPPVPLGPPPPGYYRVKPGDTLYHIALENGQNYRDIAAWNNLSNPNQIEVDQLLRVVPPGAPGVPLVPGAVAAAPGAPSAPPAPGVIVGGPLGASSAQPPLSGSGPAAVVPAAPPATGSAVAPAGGIALAWPVRGPILNRFDDSKNKGIDIGGAAGDPVRAAGDGRVVYAGNGLRGYGNLIIIKHDATYLTAYAHNRALMVKEGDAVTKGQKIAEMGNTDSDRVMLHFEVRRQGKPVDPLKYLPPQ